MFAAMILVNAEQMEDDGPGEGASTEHYAICRCGKSENKPFCDGTHWTGFKDDKN